MTEQQTPIYLIDAPIYFFRAYYSVPPTFVDADGEAANGVYGYTQFLLDLLIREQPVAIMAAFDESLTTCFRNEIYPDYKANRELPEPNIKLQLRHCQTVTRLLGIEEVCLNNYEADDIIGSFLERFGNKYRAVIITRDKDLGQLLRPQDVLWDYADDSYSGPAEVAKKFGVTPDQLADYLALAGDSIDNIPGAPGIGAKTASALLGHFGSLDGLYERLDEVAETGIRGAKKLGQTLLDCRDQLEIYRQITPIYRDIPLTQTEQDLAVTPADPETLGSFFDQMRFGRGVREKWAKLEAQRLS